jgi:hypothetical protein
MTHCIDCKIALTLDERRYYEHRCEKCERILWGKLMDEPVRSDWRPIETAPKDGTKVDLFYAYPRGRTIDCMWRQGGVYGDGRWIWLKPTWTSQPGLGIDWHLAQESDWEVCSYPNMEPTHWMPTPLPPSNSETP